MGIIFSGLSMNYWIWKNPVIGTSEIIANIENDNNSKVVVYDVVGKKVKEFDLIEGENHLFISKDELSKGIYHVILLEDGEVRGKQ